MKTLPLLICLLIFLWVSAIFLNSLNHRSKLKETYPQYPDMIIHTDLDGVRFIGTTDPMHLDSAITRGDTTFMFLTIRRWKYKIITIKTNTL